MQQGTCPLSQSNHKPGSWNLEGLGRSAICILVLILFGGIWPLDLVLQLDLAKNGVIVEGRVLQTWIRTAKSKQLIYYSRVEYEANQRRYARDLSGPELQVGATAQVRYSPLLPLYAVIDRGRQEPPAMQTVIMRIALGAFFCLVSIAVLRQRRSS